MPKQQQERIDEPPAVTREDLEYTLRFVAWVITYHNRPGLLPLMERLERALEVFEEGQDPMSRARAILARYGEPDQDHKPNAN